MLSNYFKGFESVAEIKQHGGSGRIFFTYFILTLIVNVYSFSYSSIILAIYLIMMYICYIIVKSKMEFYSAENKDESKMFYNGYNYVMIQSVPYSLMFFFTIINLCFSLYYTVSDKECLFYRVKEKCNDAFFEKFGIMWEYYIGKNIHMYDLFVYSYIFLAVSVFMLSFVLVFIIAKNRTIIGNMNNYEKYSLVMVFIKCSVFFVI